MDDSGHMDIFCSITHLSVQTFPVIHSCSIFLLNTSPRKLHFLPIICWISPLVVFAICRTYSFALLAVHLLAVASSVLHQISNFHSPLVFQGFFSCCPGFCSECDSSPYVCFYKLFFFCI